MIVTNLALSDYRNYETLDLAMQPGANLYLGSNGQGKTNLVEALGYLTILRSHRVSADQALIRQGSDSAIVRARLSHGGREVLAELELNRSGANRARINGSSIRTRDLPRYFSSVLFAPEDLALVRGEPAGRRRFMDQLLVLRTPRLAGVIADYERVLKQRNSLLKSARASGVRGKQLGTLEIWDERLIEFGSELIAARTALVADLAPEVSSAYSGVAGAGHNATLASYLSIFVAGPADEDEPSSEATSDSRLSNEQVGEQFRAALGQLRRAELDRGLTLAGPHRDDLVLILNGLPARGYASHGESWSFALALKLASAALLRAESSSGDPVLILDDVFAELDEARRARLAGAVSGFEQVLITAAVLGDVPESLASRITRIEAGRIVPQ